MNRKERRRGRYTAPRAGEDVGGGREDASEVSSRGMEPVHLPRRAALGIACAATIAGGARVRAIEPAGAASGVLAVDDRIVACDGAAIANPAALAAALRRRAAGERVELVVVRAGRRAEASVVLRVMSEETCPDGEVEYGAITAGGWRLRTIVTRPRGADRAPGWLWLPGLACVSQDFAATPGHPARPVIAALTAAGAVTLRVELPGLGDSEGPDCGQVGFAAQVEAFAAGLRALRARPEIDRSALGLFGHSLGGWIAPLLACAGEVRGVAVHGTSGRPWAEVVRLAAARAGTHEPPPGAALAGRSPRFHAELAEVDVARAWARVPADVLVMHGAGDTVVDGTDARELAVKLSLRTCGATQFAELARAGHGLEPAEELVGTLLAWARGRGLAR